MGALPMLCLLFPIYWALYGWRLAAMHAAIVLVASLALIELLLAGFPKVPFASAYVPGRAVIRVRLTLYLMAFQFFAYVLSAIESVVLPRGAWSFAMLGVLALVYAALVRRRVARERTAVLVFDEDPPDTIQTLDLSGPVGQRLAPGA
jgi:ABC-type Fe3+-siderophore transport system permease subunit